MSETLKTARRRKLGLILAVAVLAIGADLLIYLLMTGAGYSVWHEPEPYSFMPTAHPVICAFIVGLDMTAGAGIFLIERDWEK